MQINDRVKCKIINDDELDRSYYYVPGVPGGRLLRLAGDGCWSVRQDEEGGGAAAVAGSRDAADGEDEEVDEEPNIWWWLLTSSAISVRELLLFKGRPCRGY